MHPLPEQNGECSFMERSGFIRQHTLWPHGECVAVLTEGICAGIFSKRKRIPDNPQALCQIHSPVSHSTGHFHPWNYFLDEGGITSAIVQGLNDAKPSQGHQHPVTALLGTRHRLGRGASSSHPFPSQTLLLLLSLPTGMCCFSARAKQGSTIKFTFWIWQGFI